MSFTNTSTFVTQDTECLWEELRSGNRSSLEAIYRFHINDLYNFGMSLHADDMLVKDAIQDVFIDLWNYREKLSADVVIKQYLFKCLANRIQKELGKNLRRSNLHRMNIQETSVKSFEEVLIQNQSSTEISKKIQKAMNHLPVRQKEILQYLFFQKLTYEEASKLLEINIRSTYTLAWKAINTLKKAISVMLPLLIFS